MTKDRLAALQAVSFVKTILQESMKNALQRNIFPHKHIYTHARIECDNRMNENNGHTNPKKWSSHSWMPRPYDDENGTQVLS